MKLQTLYFGFFLSNFSFGLCDRLQLDPDLAQTAFEHSSSNAISWFQFHHNASDVITALNQDTRLSAQFSYGLLHKDLVDENIEIWIDTCLDHLVLLGVLKTNSDGRIAYTFPAQKLPKSIGSYRVWMRVTGDGTSTSFMLRILAPKTQLVIFDIDSTLTLGEVDSTPRAGSSETTHRLKELGLEIVYLSGRHYYLTRVTRNLLYDNGVAEGSLIVAQSLSDIVPIDLCVGEFKANYLKYLLSLGLDINRAYGNATTDIYAFQKAQIPNDRIFILGPHGGYNGTVNLGEDFLEHLKLL